VAVEGVMLQVCTWCVSCNALSACSCAHHHLPQSKHNQPTHQPTNQPTNPPTNQPINQSTKQKTNPPNAVCSRHKARWAALPPLHRLHHLTISHQPLPPTGAHDTLPSC